MEKKTRFKLNFIKNHLSNVQIQQKKPSRRSRQLFLADNSGAKPLALYKYFDPITSHRIIGDLVFLDTLTRMDDFVPLSSLWNPFKQISEITLTANFSVCCKSDSECYSPNVGLLVERLLSLGDIFSYNLAMSISKLSKHFSNLPLSNDEKPLLPEVSANSEKAFLDFLEENAKCPIIVYHYQQHVRLGMVNSKISVNTVLKNLTFQDDIRIFEESIFVCPTDQYFSYMIKHLETCFQSSEEQQYITLYVNTHQGVKKFLAKGENFILGSERVVVLTFPKDAQTPEAQRLYEANKEIIGKEKRSTKSKKKIGKERQKNEKTTLTERKKPQIKSFSDWEFLIRKYYDPKELNHEKLRCQYKVINDGNVKNYP